MVCRDRNLIDSNNDFFEVAGHKFKSRLLVGTGKYKDFAETAAAINESGAEIVTVAVRRVNIEKKGEPMLQDFLDPKKYTYLPNTAGCFTADDAVRTLRLARAAGGWNLVYTSDDPIIARELEDIGCCAIMPLAAPIGSGLGIQNRLNIELILEQIKVPVLVDAGVGTASDAAIAMEMGCDGILMNTAIAKAQNPILMARAMRLAIESGRAAFLAGRMERKKYGVASSPLMGRVSG